MADYAALAPVQVKVTSQKSPVPPISESREVFWAWHTQEEEEQQDILPLSNIWLEYMADYATILPTSVKVRGIRQMADYAAKF